MSERFKVAQCHDAAVFSKSFVEGMDYEGHPMAVRVLSDVWVNSLFLFCFTKPI